MEWVSPLCELALIVSMTCKFLRDEAIKVVNIFMTFPPASCVACYGFCSFCGHVSIIVVKLQQ